MSAARITQIIPAPDWFSVYSQGIAESYSPLVCWALTENDEVVGLDTAEGCIMDANGNENFLRYEHWADRV